MLGKYGYQNMNAGKVWLSESEPWISVVCNECLINFAFVCYYIYVSNCWLRTVVTIYLNSNTTFQTQYEKSSIFILFIFFRRVRISATKISVCRIALERQSIIQISFCMSRTQTQSTHMVHCVWTSAQVGNLMNTEIAEK